MQTNNWCKKKQKAVNIKCTEDTYYKSHLEYHLVTTGHKSSDHQLCCLYVL